MDCSCKRCVAACRRVPGAFLPLEALRAIKAGYARRLMAVMWWPPQPRGAIKRNPFLILLPATSFYGEEERGWNDTYHRRSMADAHGRCTFHNSAERCEIHTSGFKPFECRHALLCTGAFTTDDQDRMPWDSPVGRYVLCRWESSL